jgi:mono/diheme cytochrome c family protein
MITLGACREHPPEETVDFATQIKPLLERQCIGCHQSGAFFGNLSLESRSLAFKERPSGPAIVPGSPEKSALLDVLVRPERDQKAMPPTGHRLPKQDVELIRRWIKQGASWPDGPQGVIQTTTNGKGNA